MTDSQLPDSLRSRMDPIDVLALDGYASGGDAGGALATGISTFVGWVYRLEKAREMLSYLRTEPSSHEDALREVLSDPQVRAWPRDKRLILAVWLSGCLATYHVCRSHGIVFNRGVYCRSVIRSHAGFRGRMSPATLAWLDWRLAMPTRYQGLGAVRGLSNPLTVTTAEAQRRLAGTEGLDHTAAARALGIKSGETIRKWRLRAAGITSMTR